MTLRIAVLASGGGTNLKAIIDFISAQGDLAAGRIELVASDRNSAGALAHARAASIPTEVFDSTDDGSALIALLGRHRIAFVVLAGYVKRIPPSVVRTYHRRIINIHPGLLPDFGGPGMYGERVHAAVLASGASTTGVTAHFVDDELDHGPLIAQWTIPVGKDDTAESLARRVLEVEHILYPRVVDLVAALNTKEHFADF